MTCINIRQQTSPNPELLLDWIRQVWNAYKTKIVWILPFCSIKVLTIYISRNQLPVFKTYCQYQYLFRKSIAILRQYWNKYWQYCQYKYNIAVLTTLPLSSGCWAECKVYVCVGVRLEGFSWLATCLSVLSLLLNWHFQSLRARLLAYLTRPHRWLLFHRILLITSITGWWG